jgi:DNA-binding response OmpR family regulator
MKTVLVIEDEEFLRSILHEFLLEKFNVLLAEDGWLGLQLAIELKPDLILSDVNLPELDGYKLLYLLRLNFNTTNIPFIFLTADDNPNSRFYAFTLGANDYLTKPFQFMDLLKAIETQLQNHQSDSLSFLTDSSNSDDV